MWRDLTFFIRGRVIDATSGRPLGGLHVRAYDRRLIWDDCLGCTDTEADGSFRIPLSKVTDPQSRPDVYVVIYGPALHQLHFTEPVQVSDDPAEEMRIALHTGTSTTVRPRDRTWAA